VLLNQEPSVVAVVPTLGTNIPRLNAAIRSIRQHSDTSSPRIVLVNNSPNRELPGAEPVDEILFPGMNLGWVGSIELIRRTFCCDYLWTIQDDMELLNDTATILLQRLEDDPSLAVASPVLIRNGLIPARTRGGVLSNHHAIEWHNIPESDIEPEALGDRTDLCFVAGSGAIWRMKALEEVGGFNLDLYPLVHVDVDICLRLLQAGWRIALERNAHISHEIGGSTSSMLRDFLNDFNAEKVRQSVRSATGDPKDKFRTLPTDPRTVIAQNSTYFFIHFSAWANTRYDEANRAVETLKNRISELEVENSAIRADLEFVVGSRSWRWTFMLRTALKKWNSIMGRRRDT